MLSLAEALAALPDTADGIAAHLLAKGIRGRRKDACRCPVANYLVDTGVTTDADVDSAYIGAFANGDVVSSVVTPAPVARFVVRFDAGEWPELVLDDTAEASDV